MWVSTSTANVLTPTAIALGNFDGIHLGHRQVLQPILAGAKDPHRLVGHLYPTVVTFNPHPQEFFSGQSRQLLTPLPEKVKRLEQLGVEQLVLLPFDRELATLSPQEFVEGILLRQLQAKQISVGEDFRFGYRRAGTARDLSAIASHFGVTVQVTALKTCQYQGAAEPIQRISSSQIRQALEQGDLAQATQMLGYAYTLTGTVVSGQQLGRKIGFPTANLQLPAEKLLPRQGVYCVRVFLDETGSETASGALKGVMNLGCRPTVEGNSPAVEVHLLDWRGDLYGRVLTVTLECFLRPEQKFPSLDALKAQIAADCESARQIL